MSARAPHPALAERRRKVARAQGLRRRSRLLTGLGVVAALAVAWWALSGPVTAVRSVSVVGYDRADRAELEQALLTAAGDGDMVRVPVPALRRASERFPWVGSIEVSRDWPSGVRVTVAAAEPVAVLEGPQGESRLVSAGGRVLGPAPAEHELALVTMRRALPAAGEPVPRGARAALQLAREATPATRARLAGLRAGDGVLVGRLVDGPTLRLGGPSRMAAKALALDAVLNQLSAEAEQRARYIDLTVPERPAVGGIEALPDEPEPSIAEAEEVSIAD